MTLSVADVSLLLVSAYGALAVFVLCLALAYKIVNETRVRTSLLREMAQKDTTPNEASGLVGRLDDLRKTRFSRPVKKQLPVSLFKTDDIEEGRK